MIRKLARTSGVDTAYQYMTIRRKKYQKEKIEMEQVMKQQETERALQVQQAAMQAKQMEQQGEVQLSTTKISAEMEKELAVLREKYRLEAQLEAQKFEYNAILKGVDDDGQMAKEKYKEDRKDERVEKTAKVNAKQQQEIIKMKEGSKPEVESDNIEVEENNLEELI